MSTFSIYVGPFGPMAWPAATPLMPTSLGICSPVQEFPHSRTAVKYQFVSGVMQHFDKNLNLNEPFDRVVNLFDRAPGRK